jgi:hypothetical protein
LLIDPVRVVSLLLGADISGIAIVLSRCFGVSLLALGLACWPGRRGAEVNTAAVQAMVTYNVLIALALAYVGVFARAGLLLWPVVLLHVLVALALIWAWHRDGA